MNQNAQHTPSPWRLADGSKSYIIGDNGQAVCSVWADGGARRQAHDARLIAAAPVMLETLATCYEALSHMSTQEFEHGADRPIRLRLYAVLTALGIKPEVAP